MYTCSVCGKEGTPEGDKEFKLPALGKPSAVWVSLGKDPYARRSFDLCEKCAKDFNFKDGDCIIINKKHKMTIENLLK